MESSILQATRSDLTRSFSGLNADERRRLRDWQTAARIVGIDAVEDLTSRPWPCPVAGTVIGVFQTENKAARWLVIGHNGAWAVACCADGEVSRTVSSLSEALAVIYPGQAGRGRSALLS